MRAIFVRYAIVALCVAAFAVPLRTEAGPAGFANATPAYGSRTIYAEFDLKSLPATVQLCNSARFLDGYGYDLIWVAGVGLNAALGAFETLIVAHTPLQQFCGVSTSAPLDMSVQAALYHMDFADFTNGYTLVAGLPVSVDIAGGKILVQADRGDPAFANVSAASQAYFFAIEGMPTAPGGGFSPLTYAAAFASTYPRDDADFFNYGSSFTDATNDVCTANMACASSTHPQIDLIGGTLYPEPVVPPPVFGGNTIDVEFDLSSLPTMVNLCNSNAFLENSGYDLLWVAGVHFNAAWSTYETLITAHTVLRQNCGVPMPALLESALQASLFHFNPADIGNGYALVGSLPFTVDIAGGKILVKADRSDPAFSGWSGTDQALFFTMETALTSPDGAFSPLVLAGALGTTYPRDDAAPFDFGAEFTDPANDVCTANLACASSTHAQIDLIGGSAHFDDYVFRNSFE